MTAIPQHMLARAPRVWIDQGAGLMSRVIDPAWRSRTLDEIEAEIAHEEEIAARRLLVEEAEHAIAIAKARMSAKGKPLIERRLVQMKPMLRLMELIAAAHGTTSAAVMGDLKIQPVLDARQHAAHALRSCGHSFETIGRALHRDGSTARTAVLRWPVRAKALGLACEPLPEHLQPTSGAYA